jgi:heme A synthase
MDWLVELHKHTSDAIAYYSLIVGLWGLFNFLRREAPDGNYNGALVIAIVLYLLEGVMGIVLLITGLQPARGWIHFLYGITIALTIPATFAFTRGANTSRESMIYGLVLVFNWGLALRAQDTALNG